MPWPFTLGHAIGGIIVEEGSGLTCEFMMGQFMDAGKIETSCHRIRTEGLDVLGSWAFTGNDLPPGVDMLSRARDNSPRLHMQTVYPVTEDGVSRAVADAMAMRAVKFTIVPFPELVD